MAPLAQDDIEGAFIAACRAELQALKPGNVHVHAAGHGMEIAHFERAAAAAAPFIAEPDLSVGQRILRATEASFGATGLNTNLGIILLCVPLAKAASETNAGMGLRRRLAVILSMLDKQDAADAFAAIRIANPAGLGDVERGDVRTSGPDLTLIEAMHLASGRDRIANAYVTAYEDVFDFALPALSQARSTAARDDLAITTLHMALLAQFADSHIGRQFGAETAEAIRAEAATLSPCWVPVASHKSLTKLLQFDSSLKSRGLNPGTTADFVVASLFAADLSRRKPS